MCGFFTHQTILEEGKRINYECGINIYTLLYIKRTNKDLLHSIGKYTPLRDKNLKKNTYIYIYIYIYKILNYCVIYLKLTQLYKLTMLQIYIYIYIHTHTHKIIKTILWHQEDVLKCNWILKLFSLKKHQIPQVKGSVQQDCPPSPLQTPAASPGCHCDSEWLAL